jgi:hypothetical protein
VNARDDAGMTNFLSKFGLPTGEEIDEDTVRKIRRSFSDLLARAGSENKAAGMKAVNDAIARHQAYNLQPALHIDTDGRPQMMFRPQNLIGLMLMECSAVLLNDARFATCEHCKSAFLTGPLTWRRAHAVYCSDRCRVAAMRARNSKRPSKRK